MTTEFVIEIALRVLPSLLFIALYTWRAHKDASRRIEVYRKDLRLAQRTVSVMSNMIRGLDEEFNTRPDVARKMLSELAAGLPKVEWKGRVDE